MEATPEDYLVNQQIKDWIGEWHNITADSRALPLSSASSTIV